jgi:hypothetical protein
MSTYWDEQMRIRNEILDGERAAAAARPQVATPPMHDWFLAAQERARADELARLERDRAASDAHVARQQQQAQAMQDAQRAWAVTRNDLRAKVIELQRLLAGAESRMNSGELDDAVRASGEAEVYRVRLAGAEQAYAQHSQRSPM